MAIPDSANLLAGWEADATLWQNTARTTAVTADGDPVAVMDDVSGNGKNQVRTSDDGRRPLYKTNIINGLPAVLFDGSDDNMNCNGTTIVIPTQWSAYVVAKATTSKTAQTMLASDAFDQGTQIFQLRAVSATAVHAIVYGGAGTAIDSVDPTSAFRLYEVIRATGDVKLYHNQSLGQDVVTTGTNASGTQGITLGANGNMLGVSGTWQGYIASALFYTGAHDATTRLAVEDYFAVKYGLFAASSTAKFRKTLSGLGGRTSSRQLQGH